MICLTATVCFVNPAPVRMVLLPETFTVSQAATAFLIAFGLEPILVDVSWIDGSFPSDGGDKSLSEAFPLNQPATLHIRKDGGIGVRVAVENTGIPEGLEKQAAASSPLPVVVLAYGYHLPSALLDTRKLSAAFFALNRDGSFQVGPELSIFEDMLLFSEKKVTNQMRKQFQPDTAIREINMSVSLPLYVLLTKWNVTDLRALCNNIRSYYYSTDRKSDLIEHICSHFSHSELFRLIDALSLQEFLTFREAILRESRRTIPEEEVRLLPTLSEYGLVSYVNKVGWMFSRELLDVYDEIYATPKESEFIRIRYFKTALRACTALYGVFDRKMLCSVLRVILPDYREEDLTAWLGTWREYHSEINTVSTEQTVDGIFFNTVEFTTAKAKKFWPLVPSDEGSYCVPDAENILHLAGYGLTIADPALEKRLEEIVQRRPYWYDRNTPDQIQNIILDLHRSVPLDDIQKKIISSLYLPRSEGERANLLGNINSLLLQLSQSLPLAQLGGYPKNHCPEETLKNAMLRAERLNAQPQPQQAASKSRPAKTVKGGRKR